MTDESLHLCQPALYVEPVSHPVHSKTFPANGHEYIHKVRIETSEVLKDEDEDFYDVMPAFKVQASPAENVLDTAKPMRLAEWKCQEANFFSKLASELNRARENLKKKFPPKQPFPPIGNEQNVCLFCLGTELFKELFPGLEVDEVSSQGPLLSIVLHWTQEDIVTVLGYFNKWGSQINMSHTLCRWMYALLACIKKPVSDECQELLEVIYNVCYKKTKKRDMSEKYQLHLILAILRDYFCIIYTQLGPELDSFVPLC